MNQSRMSNGFVSQMMQTHPQQPRIASDQFARAVQALSECVAVCTTCVDASLAEQHVQQLLRCIRLNLDCADICGATAAVLDRPNNPGRNVLLSLLQACQAICESCRNECEQHAQMHEHCRVCAESCRHCAQLCSEMMQSV